MNREEESNGAVADAKFSLQSVKSQDVLLIACDNLFEFNLKYLIDLSKNKNSSAVALKVIDNKELIKKYSQVFLDEENRVIFFEEKPKNPISNISSTACYFLNRFDVERIKSHNFCESKNLGDIISFLCKESKVYGKIFDEFWIDIGSFSELQKAREHAEKKLEIPEVISRRQLIFNNL